MYHRILIPLDGSPVAEQVLPLSKMIAERFQSSVVLFRAIDVLQERLRVESQMLNAAEQAKSLRASAMEYLTTVLDDFKAAGIPAELVVEDGPAAAEILHYAETAHIDLVTMATHGRTGLQRWVYGSVADKVLCGARVPLLLARASEPPIVSATIDRILVPLDGSELAERALLPAQCWAKALEAEVVLFRVWQPIVYAHNGWASAVSMVELDDAVRGATEAYLCERAQELESQGVRVRWAVQLGAVAERILEAADKYQADLIVMSTHGRSGIGRWVMGSTADRVLRTSPIPVLLVRSGAVLEQA